MTCNVYFNNIEILNTQSTAGEIHAALEVLAHSIPDPITLDQCLRRIAKKVDSTLKAVRESYHCVLKKLNIMPQDIGHAVAKKVLDTVYESGFHLKMTPDGIFHVYDKSHWRRTSDHLLRAQLQEAAVEYKALTDKSLHSIVNDALGSLKDYLGTDRRLRKVVPVVIPSPAS